MKHEVKASKGESKSQTITDDFHQVILDAAPYPVLALDSNNVICYHNREACRFFEIDSKNLLGLNFAMLVSSNDSDVLELVWNAAETSESFSVVGKSNGAAVNVSVRLSKNDPLSPIAVCFCEKTAVAEPKGIVELILESLMTVRPLPEVLQEAVRLLVDVAAVDHVTLTLINDSRTHFVFEAEYPSLSGGKLLGKTLQIEGMPTQESLLLDRKPLVIRDVENHPISNESQDVEALVQQFGVNSQVIVPLIFQERVIGTIGVDSIDGKALFTVDEVEMYCTIASHIAIAIENSRLVQSDKILRRIYREAESGKSLQDVAAIWLEKISEVSGCTTGSLQLIVGGSRSILHSVGFDHHVASSDLLPKLEHDELVRSTIEKGDITIINTSTSHLWGKHGGTSNVSSWMCVPLRCGEGVDCVVTLDHSEPEFFGRVSSEKLDIIRSYSIAASSELRDAYLFHAGGSHIKAYTLLGRIAELLGNTIGTDDLLARIAKEATVGLGGDYCCVYLHVETDLNNLLKPSAMWPSSDSMKPPAIDLTNATKHDPIAMSYREASNNDSTTNIHSDELSFGDLPWNCQSVMIQPVLVGTQCVGILTVGSRYRKKFRESDQLLLKTVSRLVANALQREAGIERLHAINSTANAEENLDQTLTKILAAAKDLSHKDDGVIFLLNESCNEVSHHISLNGWKYPVPRLENSESVSCFLIRHSADGFIDVPDVRLEPRLCHEVKRDSGSLTGHRLCLDGQCVGLLYLKGKNERSLTTNERWFIARLCDYAAAAIERNRLTTQLRDAEAKFHSLIDNVPVCVYRKNKQSVFETANLAFCTSVGKSLEEIAGKATDFDFYPKEIAEQYVADDVRVLSGEVITKDERHIRPIDNREVWVRIHKTPVRDGDGAIVGTQGMFWDITEEKLSADREKAISEYNELLVTESPIAIVVVDSQVVTMANDSAASLLGWSAREAMKGQAKETILKSLGILDTVEFLGRLKNQRKVEFSATIRGKSQDVKIALHSRDLPVSAATEQWIFHDVTYENKRLVEINHQVVNNLDVAIKLMKMQKGQTDSQPVGDALQSAIDRIEAIVKIHNLLLKGHVTSNFQMTDLAQLLSNLTELIATAHGADHVKVITDFVPVKIDIERACVCGMVVFELVTNVFKHAIPKHHVGGELRISLRQNEQDVSVHIADNGRGVSSNSRSLGLSLVKNNVESRLLGKYAIGPNDSCGTLVSFSFPYGEV